VNAVISARRSVANLAAVSAVIAGSYFVLSGHRSPPDQANRPRQGPAVDLAHAEPAVPVTIAVAQLESLQTTRSAVGWIEPVASVKVRARIEGEVVERLVDDGQEVSTGDLLLRLDDGPIQAQIAREEATLARDVALPKRPSQT
jgi:multidrug efflux pump subunit AcrA (membrane-fusion protein)